MINGSIFGASLAARDSSALMKDLRATLTDLQRQLATGEKSQTYGGLGAARRVSLDVNARLSAIDGYSGVIQNATLRIKMMDQSLTQMNKIASDMKSAAKAGSYEPDAGGRTVSQVAADDQMKLAIDALNAEIGGRYLFSGRSADVKPVAGYDEIMNGAGGRAGLKQMIAERTAADLGVGGRGRLAAPTLAGATVTLARDSANPGPFGFTISGVASESSNVSTTGPTGALQSIGVSFTGQPADNAAITVTLALPDGSTEDVRLVASSSGAIPAAQGTFGIGATPTATAANFRAALDDALSRTAKTALASASAVTASQALFAGSASAPPMRVPSPAASATALVAGTAGDTVIWYRGDDDTATFPNARTTALAKVGDGQTIAVGARASEDALKQVFSMLGVLSAVNVGPNDPNGQQRYEELADRVRRGLSFPDNMQSVAGIQVEISMASASMSAAKERHSAMKNILQDTRDGVQKADPQDVAASILALQTRLEATYATTASLAQLSLTQYLR